MKEFNFITNNVSDNDKMLFFGTLANNDTFVELNNDSTMLDILEEAAWFQSKSQARKKY